MKTGKQHNAPHTQSGFKGYTLDELRYQRAVLALKAEYCKERIFETAEELHKKTPFSSQGQKIYAKGLGGILGKIVSGLSYVDIALVGFSAFNSIRKISSIFRKH